MPKVVSRILVVLLALSASVSIATAGLVRHKPNPRVIEANVTGDPQSVDLSGLVGDFKSVDQEVEGSKSVGDEQPGSSWLREYSYARQASEFHAVGVIEVSDRVYAGVRTQNNTAVCNARSFFRADFWLASETNYELFVSLQLYLDDNENNFILGDGEGRITTTVSFTGPGVNFNETVEVEVGVNTSASFFTYEMGTLQGGEYTFTVETVCSAWVDEGGTGEPLLRTGSNLIALTVPEPATAGVLGVGVLAGLLRRRRRRRK